MTLQKINYAETAKSLRREILIMLHRANGSFAGGALSCIDIITVLFHGFMRFNPRNPKDPNRDMFILSKGHSSSALYAGLYSVGMIDRETLASYGMDGSSLIIHPKKDSYPGIDVSSGALGHGIALGTGSALAARIMGSGARVFVLMGDGECNEGSVWENAAFASRQKLGNLTVIVDRNGLQGCGYDKDVLNYGDMGEKFRAFGFHVIDIDGHNYGEIEESLERVISNDQNKPAAIIAETIKGKGVSFMENRLEWHYKSLNDEQLKVAMGELA
ncbi:MAG: transketolase [Treponema sp.]|jgi:transketolase|nr:transketolase [Treponema sp.]